MESWYAIHTCAERAKTFKFLQCNWRSGEAQWGRFCFWLLWLAFLKMTGELQAITNLFQPAEIHLCETTSTICKSLEWEQRKGRKHGSVFVFVKDLQSLLHITYAYSAVYGNSFNPPFQSLSRTLTLSHFLPDSYLHQNSCRLFSTSPSPLSDTLNRKDNSTAQKINHVCKFYTVKHSHLCS